VSHDPAHIPRALRRRWGGPAAGGERANKDSFLIELCRILEVPSPEPSSGDRAKGLCVFERAALIPHAGGAVSVGKIDLYKHRCFILEAKQGSVAGAKKQGTARRGTPAWHIAMRDAFGQALGYARVTARSRGVKVIDLVGLAIEDVRLRFPEVYQWVYERVKPERDQNNRDAYRLSWWIFGEPRANFRPALNGLPRYISTVETAKHRVFVFLDASIRPDNMLVNIAHDDAWVLGVLSSRIHVTWALAAGGTLEDRPRYNKGVCFDRFPFPDGTDARKQAIRDLGEQLDAHRKRQQAAHLELTLTGMYNVLAKVRGGEVLTGAEQRRAAHPPRGGCHRAEGAA